MSKSYIECENSRAIEDELANLREAYDELTREVYDSWQKNPSLAPDWWLQAGRPLPPSQGQGYVYRPGQGWVHWLKDKPLRTAILSLGNGRALIVVNETRLPFGLCARRRSSRPTKLLDQLLPPYRARLDDEMQEKISLAHSRRQTSKKHPQR